MTENSAKTFRLSRNTVVPIGAAVAVAVAIGAFVMHERESDNAIINRFDQSDIRSANRFDNVERKLGEIENRIGSQWTRRDMEELWRLFYAKNQNLVPVEIPR